MASELIQSNRLAPRTIQTGSWLALQVQPAHAGSSGSTTIVCALQNCEENTEAICRGNARCDEANMQEDHRIFMAVSALKRDEEHEELKKLLRADGDQYLDELGRYGREEWHTIFASTRSESVLRHIFQRYQFYYGTYLSYPFIIAKGDLNLWIDWLRRLLKNGLKGATRDIIENTHCVIMTDWDHGLEMFT